ncbi:MAG: ATP-binding protein [Myxococcota bacterium]
MSQRAFLDRVSYPSSWVSFAALAPRPLRAGSRDGYTAMYRRFPRFLQELKLARHDGSYPRLLQKVAKTDLIVLDDWGIKPMTDEERRDILEVIEDRVGTGSVVVTSQLPVSKWHEYIGDPTVADAILDRIVHAAHELTMKGPSMRKRQAKQT